MREVPLSTLSAAEQDELVPHAVKDSGRVFREMSLEASSARDGNVARWISPRVARRYRAEHQVHPRLPHWIIAESGVGEVAPPVLEWLTKTLNLPD